jgi:hypothetical protein
LTSSTDRSRKAGQLYTIGLQAVHRGGEQLHHLAQHLPLMIKGTVDFDGPLWPERALEPDGRIVKLDRFLDYLLKPAREGLGLPNLHFLKRVLEASDRGAIALKAVREELQRVDHLDFDERANQERDALLAKGEIGSTGRPSKGIEHIPLPKMGSARLAARLARDRPDLSKRTTLPKSHNDHLSIHAAAVEAGIVRKTFTVPDDIKLAAKALAQHFGPFDALGLADAIEAEVHRRMEN